MESIGVLIVGDNPQMVEHLSQVLKNEKDIEVIGTAQSSEDGIREYQELAPDVVLMGRDLPGIDGFQATEGILNIDPIAQVIITGLGKDLPRLAIKAGATDYLTEPMAGEHLISSVREAAEKRKKFRAVTGRLTLPKELLDLERSEKPLGKIVAVYSGKGGVGCTTLATNLAIALNSNYTPTVLVDTDLQFGDVTAFMNLQARYSIADLAAENMEYVDEEMIRGMLVEHASGVSVLAAPPKPEMADEVTVEGVIQVLEALKKDFPYIVVDTDSYLNEITLAVLEAAELIVIIATPDIPSVKNTRALFDTFIQLDIPLDSVVLVLNQVERKDAIRAEKVAGNLKQTVTVEIPFDRESVKGTINRGEPLLLNQKTHPLARKMMELVGEVKKRLMQETVEGN